MFSFRTPEAFTNEERAVFDEAEALLMDEDSEKEKEDDEEEAKSGDEMDESGDEEEAEAFTSEQFVFPPSDARLVLCTADGFVQMRFDQQHIPKTLPFTSPQVVAAMATIKGLTAAHKLQFSYLPALPMPVHMSPLITLFESKQLEKGNTVPWKPMYGSWMMSVFQLGQFMEMALAGVIPVPASTDPMLPKTESLIFQSQVKQYKNQQYARIAELHRRVAARPDDLNVCLQLFIGYLEDFSIYWINSMERYLFKVLIEPHHSSLQLENILTPREFPTLNQVQNKAAQQQLLAEFFEIKVGAYKDRERKEPNTKRGYEILDVRQIKHRISVNGLTGEVVLGVREQDVYLGYIDRQTILEYFLFLDRDCIVPITAV